jgi:hypothetical protein
VTAELVRLLRALGHDPTEHTAERKPGPFAGVLVTDAAGPVRFYTAKVLRRKGRDAEFLRAWEAAG